MNKKLLVTALSIGTLALAGVTAVSASTLVNREKPAKSQTEMVMQKSDGLAEFLNMTQDDLRTTLDTARTKALEELAVTKGKTVDELNTFLSTQTQEREAKLTEMQTKMKEKLAEDVTAGKITQAQADEMLANPGKGQGRGGEMGHRGPIGEKPGETTDTTIETES